MSNLAKRSVKINKLYPDEEYDSPPEGVSKADGKNKYWNILRHNGVLFPADYVPLPSNIKINFRGKPHSLDNSTINSEFNMTAEEAAYLYSKFMELDLRNIKEKTKYDALTTNEDVRRRFFADWRQILAEVNSPIKTFQDFEQVDFMPIVKYIENINAQKKSRLEEKSELKKRIREAKNDKDKEALQEKLAKDFTEYENKDKEALQEKKSIYGYAILDGEKLPVSGYQIQPPQIFKGHKSPNTGRIYKRISPSEVDINVSRMFIPMCSNRGVRCNWGQVYEDNHVQWLARYKNPITKKYATMTIKRANSKFVKSNDKDKFNIARRLEKHIDSVRQIYLSDMKSSNYKTMELATAVYFLDKISIRPGTNKDENSSTKGLTTLDVENLKFGKDNFITLDFLGKSSVKFEKTFKISSTAYGNLEKLCKGKSGDERIFKSINDTILNEYLHTLLKTSDDEKKLTSKVFRTWKASSVLQRHLDEISENDENPKASFDEANQAVAIELNHKTIVEDKSIEKQREVVKKIEEELKTLVERGGTSRQITGKKKTLATAKTKLTALEENIAVNTSKQNYMDPRIIVAYCKRTSLPIENIFSATDCEKFSWAMLAPSTWNFNVMTDDE